MLVQSDDFFFARMNFWFLGPELYIYDIDMAELHNNDTCTLCHPHDTDSPVAFERILCAFDPSRNELLPRSAANVSSSLLERKRCCRPTFHDQHPLPVSSWSASFCGTHIQTTPCTDDDIHLCPRIRRDTGIKWGHCEMEKHKQIKTPLQSRIHPNC